MKKRKKTKVSPCCTVTPALWVPGQSLLEFLLIPVVGPMCGCGWHGIVGDEGQCVAVGGGEFDLLAHPHT